MFNLEWLKIFTEPNHKALEDSQQEAITLSLENNGELDLTCSKA